MRSPPSGGPWRSSTSPPADRYPASHPPRPAPVPFTSLSATVSPVPSGFPSSLTPGAGPDGPGFGGHTARAGTVERCCQPGRNADSPGPAEDRALRWAAGSAAIQSPNLSTESVDFFHPGVWSVKLWPIPGEQEAEHGHATDNPAG